MINLIRFIFGYVTFIIKSPFPERFFNLIAKHGIGFWDMQKDQKNNDETRASVLLSEYKDIKKIARKTNAKTKIINKKGIPFLIRKYRNRIGLLIGFFISIIIINIMSSFVWVVEINGNNKLNENTINKYVAECGIYQGASTKNIDVSLTEHNIMSKFKDISWISININGSVVRISINERITPPDIKEEEPCNIIASDDGQIVGIEVSKGKTEIQLGDAVVKGQMLVNGIVPDIFGENRFCHSEGNIYAVIHKNITHKIDLNKKIYIKTGSKIKRSRLEISNFIFPLSIQPIPKGNYSLLYKETDLFKWKRNNFYYPIFNNKENIEFNQQNINTFGFKFPIKIIDELFEEQFEKNIRLNEDDAKNEINNKINEFEKSFFENMEIINKNVNMKIDNNNYIAEIEYTYKKNIAIKEKLKIS